MHKILVSRCLLGERVRYDGGANGPLERLVRWQAEGRVVPICPEVAGGLPTPRPPAEILGAQGGAVLEGRLPVLTDAGEDVTEAFLAGAGIALRLAEQHGVRIAVLKARSPSCGNVEGYDGSFSGHRVPGEGVTAALLSRAGVRVFNETQLAEAERALAELEAEGS
ncbi:DUF523 domain-containing protein [Zestomonas carbonaria]|uniref:DUF523 domain-containing protein n=1 Tax=Zestomonas carbonaria TaxID=2762745 RepID=A0A7U7EK73_9GAMM|nr:DUF523 domain-containing protein [Pseudomonas carbonaria]CAD5106366.1 hypothetical protein PSEWESI4_00627 [Pseudomonas carbonaria]